MADVSALDPALSAVVSAVRTTLGTALGTAPTTPASTPWAWPPDQFLPLTRERIAALPAAEQPAWRAYLDASDALARKVPARRAPEFDAIFGRGAAARVRDQLQGLDSLTADQKMSLGDSSVSRDVIALAADEREVITLRDLEDLSGEETAAVLGVTLPATGGTGPGLRRCARARAARVTLPPAYGR